MALDLRGLIHSPPDLMRSFARPVIEQIALGVDAREIACIEPAVRIRSGNLFIAEIALDDARAPRTRR